MIENALWHLGGSEAYKSDVLISSMYYEIERSTLVYGNESATWIGKIALMYPSDYGYATGGGTTKSRQNCLIAPFYTHWSLDEYSDRRNNDWLYKSTSFQITMTPYTKNAIGLFMIGPGGRINSVYGRDEQANYSVKPAVYLSSRVKIIAGNGTSNNPFVLSL